MTSFVETRVNDLIESVSLQTVGGRQFNTGIVSTVAGFEKRNINWAQSRGRWEFGDRIVLQSELDALIDHFETVAGKAVGFRFKDWSDYRVKVTQGVMQKITDTTYQLKKSYGGSRVKTITKPVSIHVFKNGIETSAFTFDNTTGIVTFTVAPLVTDVLSWSGEFDLPARFDSDQLQSRFEAIDEATNEPVHYLFSLPVVELRT